MLSPLPRHSDWNHSCSFTQSYQPSPRWRPGRPVQRPFRGLLSVHSRYGLHTCAATYMRHASPEASTTSLPPQLLRLLPAGTVAGWGFHPRGNAALPRRTPGADINRLFVLRPFLDGVRQPVYSVVNSFPHGMRTQKLVHRRLDAGYFSRR